MSECLGQFFSQPEPGIEMSAQHRSYITYSLPGQHPQAAVVTLLESPSILGAAGTTGFRTWEAALHLGHFLCSTKGQAYVNKRSVLEIGAGTGLLSILCAKHLGAKSVIATDGAREILTDLKTNIELNDVGDIPVLRVESLKWGHSIISEAFVQHSDGAGIDLAFGSDIVRISRQVRGVLVHNTYLNVALDL